MSKKDYVSVRDVMNPKVETINGLAPISEAIKHMRENDVSALLIDRRDEFDEYGLLTDKNIATQVIEPDLSPDRVSCYEAMTKPVIGVDVKMNIRYAIRLLTRFDLTRALVLENGQAVGMVTLKDMVLKYMDHHHH